MAVAVDLGPVVVTPTLRYVVLFHTGYGEDHFDLMLETDATGPLLTWRCPSWPPAAADSYTPLPPHRRKYLDYEGDVSDDRGRVQRADSGVYAIEHSIDIRRSGAPLTIRIRGRLLDLPARGDGNRA